MERDAPRCAACGIVLDSTEAGVCCEACLEDYPGLRGKSRDEVTIWLWQHWGTTGSGKEHHVDAARAWLRIQAQLGRHGAKVADEASAIFGVSKVTRQALRSYEKQLRGLARREDCEKRQLSRMKNNEQRRTSVSESV